MISKSLRKACALCVALVVSTSVVACQQLPAPDPAQSPVTWATEAVVTLAPTITTELAMTGTVPAPNAGYSVVAGVVVKKSDGAPPSEAVMFLGELVGMEDNFPLVTVDRQKSPKAIPSSDTGRFIFVDVPPGQYGVVYWTPDGSFPVDDPQQPGTTLILKLEPGMTQDIGTLQVQPQ